MQSVVRRAMLATSVAAGLTTPWIAAAQAYPIDCAILLCLAGGFPASAECSAAKTEVIRRITPWPIEPPLQLWRCPMGGGSISVPSGGEGDAGDVSPEVTEYRDAIEVWELFKRTTAGSGGRDVYVTAVRNSYNDTGDFVRVPVSQNGYPDWLDSSVLEHTGHDLMSEYGNDFRAIMLRMKDYTGTYTTEWVSY